MTDVSKMSIVELARVIGWTRRHLADYVEFDERTIRRWDEPKRVGAPPSDIRERLEKLAAFHLGLPELPSLLERRARRRAAAAANGAGY